MRLKYQLFLTLLLFSVVLIALLAVINSWSFNRGFSKYVLDTATQRLGPTVEALQDAYIEYDGWEWVETEPYLLREVWQFGRPVERPLGRAIDNRRQDRPNPDVEVRGVGRGERRGDGRGRLVLLDSERKTLLGQPIPPDRLVALPIIVEEQTVGYLGFREPRGIPGDLAAVFTKQQLRSYAYAAVAMVVLSAILAIVLASRVVRPILSVKKAVQTISGGDYEHQIETKRQDEVGDLARNINQLSQTLKNNQTARQQWMAEISHELRTPVAVLQGELEAMQDGITAVNEEAVDSLHAESVRLGLLINDLHDLSMSDVGALDYQMQAVDVGDILQQRLQASHTLMTQAGLNVSLDIPAMPILINGDSKRLAQLFDNLSQNSIRYTETDGNIVIRLTKERNECVLDWSDSSPGVSDDQLPKLFNALYRTDDSRSRETGGSGLGLAIVKKIIDAHGASVRAYHSDMQGLGIQIRFPL